MKRTALLTRKRPMDRKVSLARTGIASKGKVALKRTGRIRTKPTTKAKTFAKRFHSHEYVDYVHSLGCSAPRCRRTDIEAAHVVRKRSKGGRWNEIAPLCKPHHDEQEGRTAEFDEKYGTDLELIAAAVALRWLERTKPLAMYGPPGV